MYQEYSLTRAEAQLKQMEKVLTQQNQCRELELTAMRGEITSLKKVNNPETILLLSRYILIARACSGKLTSFNLKYLQGDGGL